LTSKIHAAVDDNGEALNFIITDGSVSDCTQAENLLEPIIHEDARILGDRAYDTDKILDYIASKMAIAVIPPKKNRKVQREYDKESYKNRNQVERFFNRLKNFRRVATRYDKLASSFLAFVQLAATLILIPKFPPIV